MPHNTSLDSIRFDDFSDFGYDRLSSELSANFRLIRGENAWVSPRGKLSSRPGTVEVASTNLPGYRIERLWSYETVTSPSKTYLLCSAYNQTTGLYEMFYKLMTVTPVTVWTTLGDKRGLDVSRFPHILTVDNGKCYIQGFPAAADDLLGSVVFDGEPGTPTVRGWGVQGPETPARISGTVTQLTADLNTSATALTVSSSTGFPATPFIAQIDFERVQVTTVSGLNWTIVRGFDNTVPAAHDAKATILWRNGWAASAHRVDVRYFWKYTYAYKTASGHVSNRAPFEANPDLLPSRTGAFEDLCPKLTLTGSTDPDVTRIVIYRTLDGGGRNLRLDEIDNAAGTITYEDKSFVSGPAGATTQDPVPDAELDTAQLAPDLLSNSVPPTVLSPLTVGVDQIANMPPQASYAGRIWRAIGASLFCSSREELNEGVPQEAWSAKPQDFIPFPHKVTHLAATSGRLYVITTEGIHYVEGSTRDTFVSDIVTDKHGGHEAHPRACVAFGDKIAFLTHDFRIALLEDNRVTTISDRLYTDIVDLANVSTNIEFELAYFADLEKQWLVLAGWHKTGPTFSRAWVLDLKKYMASEEGFDAAQGTGREFWNVPWYIPATAMLSARLYQDTTQRRLTFAMFRTGTPFESSLSRLDPTGQTGTDWVIDERIPLTFSAETGLMSNPAGNHVNTMRLPGMTSILEAISVERTLYPVDTDVEVYIYTDDLWTDPQAVEGDDPASRPPSKGFKTQWHRTGGIACDRVALKFLRAYGTKPLELQTMSVVWSPETGRTQI